MICIAWWGFPQYAARCVATLVKSTSERVVVLATRPTVPIEGMDELCGCEVKWISESDVVDIKSLCGEIPRVLFTSGWAIPAFNRVAGEVKKNGGRVIAMVDNNFDFSIKEILRSIRFRLFLSKKFDGYLVPGKSGVKLLRFYGVSADKIATGMYSADASLFKNGAQLSEREKRIVYVGQFCERKNVLRLAEAFKRSGASKEGWRLSLYGCGPLKDALLNYEPFSIEVNDFVQPEKLAGVYQSARIFALASLEEHWGLVVHEAALSGCVLLLSRKIGAAADFVGSKNAMVFDEMDVDDMSNKIKKLIAYSESQLEQAQAESLTLAGTIKVVNFALGCKKFL